MKVWDELTYISHLMPWPGPHSMPSIHKFLVPGPIDMQSSPVLMVERIMAMLVERWTWMPSVFGLFPDAMMLTPWRRTLLQPFMTMWNIWLFNDNIPFIIMLLELVKLSVWTQTTDSFKLVSAQILEDKSSLNIYWATREIFRRIVLVPWLRLGNVGFLQLCKPTKQVLWHQKPLPR